MVPDPHQYLSYMAARTTRLDLGSMITVLPWHNPFRAAEQISVLQHHLGPDRQYFLGVGRGLARRNFHAMSSDMDTSRERFNEALDVLYLAFTQEVFSYSGRFFNYENVSVRPRPLDPSVITDAWGAWTSEASVRNMGARGLHPLTTPNVTVESYLQDLELLNEVREAHGHGPAKRPIVGVPMYCCESEQEAMEGAERFSHEYIDSITRQYEFATITYGNTKGYEEYSSEKGTDYGDGTVQGTFDTLTDKYLRDGIFGTPEQCAERILTHHELLDPSEFIVQTSVGSMTGAQAEKSLRLFGEQVLPKLAHLRTERSLAAS
jgi:alkanesulfonate monooxygenase SsuD/methylene tetrahydromethanopterin reductase-like flavin-dependent oxidoreductase (luciferase family)